MPIALVQPIAIGTALRLFLEPSPGAVRWRLLRRLDPGFAGHDDPDAAIILDSATDAVVLDATGLRNGTTFHYRLYCLVGGSWIADGDASGVPAFTAHGDDIDPLMLVRDRLDDGLASMISNGQIQNQNGRIAVLTAPPAFDDTIWPVVTVHLGNDASGERVIGETIVLDEVADDGSIIETEGWVSRVSLTIVSWSLNPDERTMLRHAISTLTIGNLPVFESMGLQQIDLSQDDTEDFTSFDAPVYQTVSTLRCLAPSFVRNALPPIRQVATVMSAKPMQVRSYGRPYPHSNKQFYR